jgi:hypothetical protein
MRPPAPFSWRAALYRVRHPGPPPRGLLGTAVVLLAITVAAIAVLIWLGAAWYGAPHQYFREQQIGTFLSVLNLVASGGVSALIAWRVRPAPAARFWWWMGALLVWVGCDDLFGIHEDVDKLLHAFLGLDPNDPITDHADDLIVAAYAVPAAALAWIHRAHLASFPWMVICFATAFGLFAAMVALDYTHVSMAVEESVKLVAGTLILVGLLAVWLDTSAS